MRIIIFLIFLFTSTFVFPQKFEAGMGMQLYPFKGKIFYQPFGGVKQYIEAEEASGIAGGPGFIMGKSIKIYGAGKSNKISFGAYPMFSFYAYKTDKSVEVYSTANSSSTTYNGPSDFFGALFLGSYITANLGSRAAKEFDKEGLGAVVGIGYFYHTFEVAETGDKGQHFVPNAMLDVSLKTFSIRLNYSILSYKTHFDSNIGEIERITYNNFDVSPMFWTVIEESLV